MLEPVKCSRCERWHTKERCPNCSCVECGKPAKWRGDRPGDHENGERYYQRCGGHYVCLTHTTNKSAHQ